MCGPLQDSRYYGCGTTDGTSKVKGVRYFTCPDNNGLFLSLASVAKQPDWLKLQNYPKSDTRKPTEEKNAPTLAKRNASSSPNVGISSTNGGTNQLPNGTRVVMTSKDGKKVKGTVRWTGRLPIEYEDAKNTISVYGIETVSYCMSVYLCFCNFYTNTN